MFDSFSANDRSLSLRISGALPLSIWLIIGWRKIKRSGHRIDDGFEQPHDRGKLMGWKLIDQLMSMLFFAIHHTHFSSTSECRADNL
jgi:hypothetical protein